MVLIIAPAIDGLKKEWREAAENMGASSVPVLAPRRPADPDAVAPRHDVLLFGNAFGAQATAYQLTGGQINIVTICITRQISGDVLHNPASATPWRWAWS